MRLVRLSTLFAVLGIALFAGRGTADFQAVPPTYFCMCYCAGGTIVCVEDTSPACNACATACIGIEGSEM
jgi:hypothetical protein